MHLFSETIFCGNFWKGILVSGSFLSMTGKLRKIFSLTNCFNALRWIPCSLVDLNTRNILGESLTHCSFICWLSFSLLECADSSGAGGSTFFKDHSKKKAKTNSAFPASRHGFYALLPLPVLFGSHMFLYSSVLSRSSLLNQVGLLPNFAIFLHTQVISSGDFWKVFFNFFRLVPFHSWHS